MSIRIVKPGFLSTLQDLGRPGFQSEGVPVCGAMDSDALRFANLLVGNVEEACCIEITLQGTEFEITDDSLIAFTGGGSRLVINDKDAPFGKAIRIGKGSTVKLQASSYGCRSYLAIGGGFQVERIMNSASTYLPSQFGGKGGRALRSGDVLHADKGSSLVEKIRQSLKPVPSGFSVASWGLPPENKNNRVMIFEGPEFGWLTRTSQDKIDQIELTGLPTSNRMGIRLRSENFERLDSKELLSTSVSKGTIQCTPDGNLIILMSDCQTTGGYARVAQVAATSLSRCAQLRPGDTVQFSRISFAEAEQLFLERQLKIEEIKKGIASRFKV